MLSLAHRRLMKESISTGDVQAAQELWESMRDSRTTFLGQPRLRSSTHQASRSAASPAGAQPNRWSSDDLLRLPAR
jgi:hypothetical protein